jgi:hypothetical protein
LERREEYYKTEGLRGTHGEERSDRRGVGTPATTNRGLLEGDDTFYGPVRLKACRNLGVIHQLVLPTLVGNQIVPIGNVVSVGLLRRLDVVHEHVDQVGRKRNGGSGGIY